MVLKLVHSWRVAVGIGPFPSRGNLPGLPLLADLEDDEEQILDYDDPVAILIRERKVEKQKHQDEEIVAERRQTKWNASQQEEQDQENRRLQEWLASEQYRHAIEVFSADIDDARQAVSRVRERAAAEQQQTHEDFEKAQRNALVAAGDRRVYFTRDGSRLYGEDDRQITEASTIAEAQRQRLIKPEATTYEDYTARKDANRLAADKAEKLGEAATKLDELDKRIKKGNLSPEDLARARQDKQDVIDSLPVEARAEYERLHAARTDERKLAYRVADPAFTSAPDLNTNFQQAVAAAIAPAKESGVQPQADRRAPVYKAAPDY